VQAITYLYAMTHPVITGLDHVVLRVRDLERAKEFYCTVLGCTVEVYRPKLGLMQLRAGDALIDLVPVDGTLGRAGGAAPAKEGRNMDHFCLRVAPFDAATISAHLRAHGIDAGEVRDRYGAEGSGPSLYLHDPDGNMVELKGPATSKEKPSE
jgi:catechol 2,3-dioxygenase-like lactoylglutathione lyase family enzyme